MTMHLTCCQTAPVRKFSKPLQRISPPAPLDSGQVPCPPIKSGAWKKIAPHAAIEEPCFAAKFKRMQTLGFILGRLFEPPFRLFVHIMFRFNGYSRLSIGSLTFWGPRAFLDSCAASVHRLKELDAELYARLTTQQRLEFFYDPKQTIQAHYAWIFSISDPYTAWHSDGIIARLVYSSQLAALIPRRAIPQATREALASDVMTTTRLWLESRHFPEPLVSCFQEEAV